MSKFKNKELKSIVWQAGCALDERGFHATMSTIRAIDEGAYHYLNTIPARFWALSYDGGYRHGVMTTNNSESFNSTLKSCRLLPVSAIVKVTYEKLALQFADRRTKAFVMKQAGLQWPRKILDEILKRESHKYRAKVKRHDDVDGVYSVALEGVLNPSGRPKYEAINMTTGICTCGEWAVDGLPCAHAHAASHYVGRVPDYMVPEKFSIDNYVKCYEGTIMPLLSEQYWPTVGYKVLPPQGIEQRRGRRGSTRIPNEMDLNGRRCGICRSANHDVRDCQRN